MVVVAVVARRAARVPRRALVGLAAQVGTVDLVAVVAPVGAAVIRLVQRELSYPLAGTAALVEMAVLAVAVAPAVTTESEPTVLAHREQRGQAVTSVETAHQVRLVGTVRT